MPFFAIQYQVLFHDTMAYGSHHYLTNFKFQNIARETILFDSKVNGRSVWDEQLRDLLLLTREAYSLSLAPVALGQRVAILLSYEALTRSTFRLCFRIIREDGQPVSCGYQTMICMHKDSGEMAPAPQLVVDFLNSSNSRNLLEKLTGPSFAERLKAGGGAVKDIFTQPVVELGKYIATAGAREAYHRIIDESLCEYSLDVKGDVPLACGNGIVFTFPGQGSFDPAVLCELLECPANALYFNRADELCRRILRQEFVGAITASGSAQDRLLKLNPDAAQIGMYLAAALIGKTMVDRGLRPEMLVGHSSGELAALAVSGAYSIETGLEIVCRRIAALRGAGCIGQMAAVTSGRDRLAEILRGLEPHSLEIAVINHPRQTVVSGLSEDLNRLGEALVRCGISMTGISSPFPFHSSLLGAAVKPFRESLLGLEYGNAEIQVYQATEGALYSERSDLARILSTQFVRKLDFASVIARLRNRGFTRFVECGAGRILTNIVLKNLPKDPEVKAIAVTGKGLRLGEGIDTVLRDFSITEPGIPSLERGAGDSARSGARGAQLAASYGSGLSGPNAPTLSPSRVPIAIVAMGCVLPGAANVEQYWHNIKEGISGIVDLAKIDPDSRRDFVAGSVDANLNIVPDKTYSLLNGTILDIDFDSTLLEKAMTSEEFARLTRGQKMLASAMGQCLGGDTFKPPGDVKRIECLLGGTADGSSELDDALLVESLEEDLEELNEPADLRESFRTGLEQICGRRPGDADALSQGRLYSQVVDRFIPGGANTFVIDAACSSSLYAVNVGIKALQSDEADLVLAGGVFAPGPANNTLFAQFRGLSATGSRPFDRDADGVIFGDGAAILALKRLPDAVACGDTVMAVIRGMGLSSDGKSPSINVPQSKGQSLAVRRALSGSCVDPNSIQYIEAHATATPVGDKVEVASLTEVFGDRPPGLPKIELGSVKALIGHTGWVSGAASIIKLCKAIQERSFPVQYNFAEPDPAMGLDGSPFAISKAHREWPANIDGCPRRAGVNGFGFGGTNAHLVLEEYDEGYHQRLCRDSLAAVTRQRLTIVGAGSLFPSLGDVESGRPTGELRFQRGQFRLPAKKLLLPDVRDHMDPSQFLVALAAEKIFGQLPDSWNSMREHIGVVIGLESKTERGVGANKRIFLDRLARLFRERTGTQFLSPIDASRILGKLANRVRETQVASGPYTLPGLMPNVTASRVSSLFDLKGPNMVIDKGEHSLFESLAVASQLLAHGDCRLVLTGAVNACNRGTRTAEMAVLLALTTEEAARENRFPVLGTLELSTDEPPSGHTCHAGSLTAGFSCYAATGCVEMLAALDDFALKAQTALCEKNGATGTRRSVIVSRPVEERNEGRPSKPSRNAPGIPAELAATYAYVQGTPIYRYTPELFVEDSDWPASPLTEHKLLVLVDQPERWAALEQSGALSALRYNTVFPAARQGSNGFRVDLGSEDKLTGSLGPLASAEYDMILAVKFLDTYGPAALLGEEPRERDLIDLLFALCRQDYDRIRDGQISVVSLALGAIGSRGAHPWTGLASGFLKSLARELPEANLAAVSTDETHLLMALAQVEREAVPRRPQSSATEVCYAGGRRHVFKLRPVERLSINKRSYLDSGSVVVATGGGRGVTGVLAEELVGRFGCKVIAAGRTDLGRVPPAVREMDEPAFLEYEADFYKDELARDSSQKIRDLKARLAWHQAANEVCRTARSLSGMGGGFEYHTVDLSERAGVDRFIDSIIERYGKIDLVLHGAGIQASGRLTKKPLAEFRAVIDAKLSSLAYIYQAIERRRGGHPVHYHILTSAFSYMGNDGQPDYGAANEALNRIAAALDGADESGRWSSMGWLGWAGIGMTRGSEFAALAANRRLRGVTKQEGREIFAEMLEGTPAAPINILMADGEIRYYGVTIADQAEIASRSETPPAGRGPAVVTTPRKDDGVFFWDVTAREAPFLRDHVVNGIPTMPAAFLTCIAAEAAAKVRPGLKITAYEETHSHRFVRVPEGRGVQIRAEARVVSESSDETLLKVRILTDFTHKSGRVLQNDILHNETLVHMSASLPERPGRLFDGDRVAGDILPDPYVIPGSIVQLNGQFASTRSIEVSKSHRIATYQLAGDRYPPSRYGYLVPNIMLVDAFWRFGTVQMLGEHTLGVYVPVECGLMSVYFDYLDFGSPSLKDPVTFRGTNPRIDGDLLRVGPIEVSDRSGNVLLIVERGVCRKFGEVKAALQTGRS